MTLKENYLNEISLLKNERIQRVIEAAKIEFNEHGIKNAKLRIIAKRAKVGEASIYRYFKDKTDLIKIVALSYWQNHANLFDDYYYGKVIHKENGLKKIEQALHIFHELYENNKEFLKFVEDFDIYMAREVSSTKDNDFQELIYSLKKRFVSIFDEGVEDGSIRSDLDGEDLYSFVSQVMISTTQKLSTRIGFLHDKDPQYPIRCLNNLIEMFVLYIKN